MEIKIADCPLGAKCEEVKTENGKQVLYRCPWYIKVKGKDPQSEIELDHFACAIAWLPTLLISNAQEVRQGAAATESFRNEMVKQGEKTQQVMLLSAQITRQRDNNLMEITEKCK